MSGSPGTNIPLSVQKDSTTGLSGTTQQYQDARRLVWSTCTVCSNPTSVARFVRRSSIRGVSTEQTLAQIVLRMCFIAFDLSFAAADFVVEGGLHQGGRALVALALRGSSR
eukprot:3371621-Rhodomonas_salina.3